MASHAVKSNNLEGRQLVIDDVYDRATRLRCRTIAEPSI